LNNCKYGNATPQAERYRKEVATYMRQKKRLDEQAPAQKRGSKGGAAAGIKSKAKKLLPPKKSKAAVVSWMFTVIKECWAAFK
jgi:hypothetical protein